ncbi:MAG: lipopolysaccharide biosynthesis protein [Burkholderiales bacterium]
MSEPAAVGIGVPTTHRLGQRALSLGAANAFEFALQFLLPVVLVRCLDSAAFGQYRLLWLVVGTMVALGSLDMPASLYYFLPRSSTDAKRLYVNQTLAFLAFAGLVAGWAVSSWNPWLPGKLRVLAAHEAVVPAFVLLWMVASLLDLLPAAEERVAWQAKAKVGLAALRALALTLAALLTRQLEPVLLVLLGIVALKLALLLVYVARHHGLRGPILRRRAFSDQLRYAAPLGAAGALYGLRVQADQWVAAALFPLGAFATFSVGALLAPLLTLFRQSVNYAFLPSMSRLQAAGDVRAMLELNSRANLMVGVLLFPLLAFAFVFAQELITIVYTPAYHDAAPVMRVYIVGLAALVLELASLTMLLRQVVFVMVLNGVVLIVSVVLDWYAAQHFGLAGAAAGSVTTIYIDRIITLRRIARCTGVSPARLQDWRGLVRLALFAALAAALAWAIVGRSLGADVPLIRVAAGGTVLGAVYGALVACFGPGREWLAALRARRRES